MNLGTNAVHSHNVPLFKSYIFFYVHASCCYADQLISYAEADPLTWLSFLVTAWDQVDRTLMQSQKATALLKNRKWGLFKFTENRHAYQYMVEPK